MAVPDLEIWHSDTSSALIQNAETVKSAVLPAHLGQFDIGFSQLRGHTDTALDNLFQNVVFHGRHAIYVISLADDARLEALLATATLAKESGMRLPQSNPNAADSRVIYVGSSCSAGQGVCSIRTRLRQHLVSAPSGTYALRLAEWAAEVDGGVQIDVWLYNLNSPEGAELVSRNTVLAVEDWLSVTLQPKFGRRGIAR